MAAVCAAIAQEPTDTAAGTKAAAESKPAAAAYVVGNIPGFQREFVGSYLINALINSGADVSDENAAAFLAAANEEQSKNKELLTDSIICEIARKTGVRYVCAVNIIATPSGNAFTLSGRVISAKTGKSRFDGEVSGAAVTMGELAKAVDAVLEKMFDGSISTSLNDLSGYPVAELSRSPTSLNELSPDTADTAAKTPTVLPEAGEKPKIAVYVTGGVPENDKAALGTRMLAAFVNSGRYRGVERSAQFLAELEKEHIKQRSGDVDDGQISALGKQFGVNIICVAAITPALGSYQVSARIIDVETAEVTHIGESNSPLKTLEDLTIVSSEVVSNMFGRQLSITPEARRPKGKYSVGAEAVYAGGLGGGIVWSDGQISMPRLGGGVSLFFSHTYASAYITYLYSIGRWESGNAYGGKYELPDMQRIDINIGVYAKYPITVLENVTIFPTAGFDYNACADAKLVRADGSKYVFDGADGRAPSGDLNELWARLGAGIDIDIGWNVYIRGEALYGARFANAFERSYVYDDGYPKLAHGPMLRVGAGIRL